MKHLKTFEAACELLAYDPKEVLPVVDKMPQGLGKATTAATKLFILSEAAWKAAGKTIDWNDYDQYKYYGWFDLETYNKKVGSSAGFSSASAATFARFRMSARASASPTATPRNTSAKLIYSCTVN